IVTAGVTLAEMRFGKAISLLLSQIVPDRTPTVMVHDSTWAEGDFMPPHQQLPANIDVVSSGAMGWIEHPDFFQDVFLIGHVTAREMLRRFIIKQDVSWISRRAIHALGDETFIWRSNIGPTYRSRLMFIERADEIVEPLGIRAGITVNECDNFSGCGL